MFRQLEQHVLLQQLQLKQQQQQLEAALSVINQPNERQRGASNPRQQDVRTVFILFVIILIMLFFFS